jgi:hypothetical protein
LRTQKKKEIIVKYSTFNQIVAEGFKPEIAFAATQIYRYNCDKSVEDRHFAEKGLYTAELEAEALCCCEVNGEDYELAFKLSQVIQDYEFRQNNNGLGGCEVKTFKELLEL